MWNDVVGAVDIEECLREGFLQRIPVDGRMIKTELAEADYDLKRSEHAFDEKDFKWCIVKCYYAMFHVSRAVLFSLGLRERRHFAIGIVLEELHKGGKLESRYVADFSSAMSAREGADYHYQYSEEVASMLLGTAKEFVGRLRSLERALPRLSQTASSGAMHRGLHVP